uniref:R3H domain containing-like n=1 Tax=Sinocyclocheilus grahami TaxID=75366 RepID=A0A672MLG7_SINGR
MNLVCAQLLFAATLWTLPCTTAAETASSAAEVLHLMSEVSLEAGLRNSSAARAILDYHNRVRSQVFPPAANMEYMHLFTSLSFVRCRMRDWAAQCKWDHGPSHDLRHIEQNLSIISGRHRSIIDLVRSWYDERHYFSYPNRCSGSVCTHYTQVVTIFLKCLLNSCHTGDMTAV